MSDDYDPDECAFCLHDRSWHNPDCSECQDEEHECWSFVQYEESK